jgi:hypothetical protein
MNTSIGKTGNVSGLNLFQYVTNKSLELTVKVFDVNGKKAKTFSTPVLELQELLANLKDLANGNYILNAFKGENFIKSIRYVKQ